MKPIPGFDGYFATEGGVIISRHGRPLAPFIDKDGYARVSLAVSHGKDAPRIHRGVHQLICMTFHGPKPFPGAEARHKDGTRNNNTPDNLAWATRQENSDDRFLHGTVPQGERHGMAKLRNRDIFAIRFYLAADFTQREVAAMFGVHQKIVQLINAGKLWKHVHKEIYA